MSLPFGMLHNNELSFISFIMLHLCPEKYKYNVHEKSTSGAFIAHAGDFQYFPAPYPTMIPWSTYVKTCRFGSRSLSLGYG